MAEIEESLNFSAEGGACVVATHPPPQKAKYH
jgi:hypothetical protein